MNSGSNLEKILTGGHFAVTGELGPPKNSDAEVVREKARILKGHVDAVNITDCQTAIVRMSSIAAGALVQAEGVEPVIQMTCRDRNRIGMQSDILGAAALGLKNLLCLTGDHQKFGNHPGAKGVFDMDSIQLLGMVRGMRDDKQFQCGEAINNAEPRLFLGCAANPFAEPFSYRAQRLAKKVASGADFVQTQIIYNVEKFAEFMRMARELGLPEKVYILAGITPPKSLGMARYMKKFVPGMDVPDAIISRMKDARDKEDEGINIAVDIINQVREIKGVAGVHVMAIEWEQAVPEIVSRAGLDDRPKMAPETEETAAVAAETITVAAAAPSADADAVLAAARAEAEKIIAAARQQVAALQPQSVTEPLQRDDAGEHEMNEKERRMALKSVRLGLEALKQSFGLTDQQYEALAQFARSEAILRKEPPVGGSASAPQAPSAPSTPPVQEDQDGGQKAAEEQAAKQAAAEAAAAQKAAEEKAAAEAEAAKKAAEEKAAAEAEAAKKAAEQKAAAEAAQKSTPAAPSAAPADLGVGALKLETQSLAERASKVPEDHYKKTYTGSIRNVALGADDNPLTVGGTTTMPFQLFEGELGNRPRIAMEILDIVPTEWPETLSRHFAGVTDNPVAWAEKCVNDYAAEALCMTLIGTDPNGANKPAAEAAKAAADVVNAVDVPVIIWGCGNAEKDTESLRELTALVGSKKVCLAPLTDSNYRSLGATAMAYQHPVVAASPIDVNLAKQLNILLENLGVSLENVLVDPSIGALGYGIEYTYSVMERIRLAAMTQQDEKLQVPIICHLGREVWKTKETRLPSDALLGDQERRGVMMEAITASCMLMSGGELMIMRHPRAIALTNALIEGLIG